MPYVKRKALVGRLVLLLSIIALLLVAMRLDYLGDSVRLNAARWHGDISDSRGNLLKQLMQIELDCQSAELRTQDTDVPTLKARMAAAAEKATAAADNLSKAAAAREITSESIGIRDAVGKLNDGVRDLLARTEISHDDLAHIRQASSSLAEAAQDLQEEAEGFLAGRDEYGRTLMLTAGACLLLALCVGLFFGVLLAVDIFNEVSGALSLTTALKAVAANDVFQERMNTLARSESPMQPNATWGLRLKRITYMQRTHVTFEAVAERNGREVLLWGKCYSWLGVLKGAQRIIWSGYGPGTWKALNALRDHNMGSPFPVIYLPFGKRLMPSGSVLLTEFIPGTISVAKFLRTDFPALSPADRRTFITRLLEYWRRLQQCGLIGMRFKCLYVRFPAEAAVSTAEFYIFDLDKTILSRNPKGFACRIGARLGNRHMRKSLLSHLTPDEMRLAETLLGR